MSILNRRTSDVELGGARRAIVMRVLAKIMIVVGLAVAGLVAASGPALASVPTDTVSFPTQPVGTTSPERTFSLLIDSGYSFGGDTPVGGDAASFSIDYSACAGVSGPARCIVTTSFTPQESNSLGYVDAPFECPVSGSCPTIATVDLEGIGGTPSVIESFGNVAIGTSATRTSSLRIAAGFEIEVVSFGVDQTAFNDFSTDYSTCLGVVGPAICTLTTTFTPGATGERQSVAYPDECPVATTGNCPAVAAMTYVGEGTSTTPATVAFGNQPAGHTSAAKTVRVTIDAGYTFGGANPGSDRSGRSDFTLDYSACAGVSGPATCSATASFTPAAVGAFSYVESPVECPADTGACVVEPSITYTGTGITPPPAVSAIAPASGPTSGGTTVTITGTNFTGATAVKFGSVAASSFTVVSATKITAVSPAEAAAVHGVLVTTPAGTSTATTASYFTYGVPAVTGISPTAGPVGGGTTVTITGTDFTGATAVKFGSVAASTFTVVSASKITAVAPAQAASVHGITVKTAIGTSTAGTASFFTYAAAPSCTGIAPTNGPTAGGTTVTITGSGFTSASAVRFGSVAATSFHFVSSTQMTAVSPDQAAGVHGILVTTPGGTSPATPPCYFTYHSA